MFLILNVIPLYSYKSPSRCFGVIQAIFGIITELFLDWRGKLYYPIKRAFNKRKTRNIVNKIKNR